MIESLTVMARGFEEDGLPLQSIQCLMALVSTSLVPEAEVRARLHLSRLLLEHTFNAQEAKKHLQKAVCSCKLQACRCLSSVHYMHYIGCSNRFQSHNRHSLCLL